jgi:hypothetical protein
VIGLGPHAMTTADWVFVAVMQVGLIALAALAIWWAIRLTREGRR